MLLELMFGNLIDNALRYTQVGGEIAVVVSQEGNRVRVDVRDNGPASPPPPCHGCASASSGSIPSRGMGWGSAWP